jgi:hypothetical protein
VETPTSAFAGFHIHFPQSPHINKNTYDVDGVDRWEFEATDSATRNTYAVYKKTVTNLDVIEEDTFDLSLIEQSLKSSDLVEKETLRNFIKVAGYDALKMQFAYKNGSFLNAEAVLKGPHYFLLMQTGNKRTNTDSAFFKSFGLDNAGYVPSTTYTDTLLDFEVKTPVKPTLDSSLTSLMYQILHDESFVSQLQRESYWPKDQYAMFKNDSTGESVLVSMYEYPKYYHTKDSATFWKKQLSVDNGDAYVYSQKAYKPCDSCEGYKIFRRDTNTVRQVINYKILKNNRLYNLYTITDTSNKQSSFIDDFFKTFTPLNKNTSSIYTDKTGRFFEDLYSKDSLTKSRARNAISNIYYGEDNIDRIIKFINNLNYGEEDYFEMKQKFITELGYIDDSCCTDKVVKALGDIYTKTTDTAYFQNEVFWALESIETKTAYIKLKELLLQDPPLFNDYDDYTDFFETFEDSLQLVRLLFPEILQLVTIEDYKEPVINLLATLLDSGYIHAKDYQDYFSKIYFDAKIEMKKQQNAEEKLLEQQSQQNFNENKPDNTNYSDDDYSPTDIDKYAALLLPFYDSVEALPKFFNRLLQSRDTGLQLKTAVLLLKNNKPVPDSVLNGIAAKDNYRGILLKKLEAMHRSDLFPEKYKKQDLIARALLLGDSGKKEFSDIQTEGKKLVSIKGKKGYVYFFKYKLQKDDEWQIGISGLQPEDLKTVSTNRVLASLTNEKLTNDKPASEQFNEQLLRLILKQHKSASHFFENNESAYLNYDEYNN